MRNALLLGAGFSYDLGMPLTVELTELFLDPFNLRSVQGLGEQLAANDPYSKGRPINAQAIHEGLGVVLSYKGEGGKNYEQLLARLQQPGSVPGKSQSDRDSYNYVFGFLYELIFAILFEYQRVSCGALYRANRSHFGGLPNLLSEHETWVFTLNHDVYLECLAIDQKIPVTYGDDGEIVFPISNEQPESKIRLTCTRGEDLRVDAPGWFQNAKGINCVRLHGGLGELQYTDRTLLCNPSLKWKNSAQLLAELENIASMGYYHHGQRVPSGRDRVVTGPDGTLDIVCRSMLTGGKKYSTTTNPKKGEEKLQLLDAVLKGIEQLTVIGYGFGDAHVNNRISNAMVLNDRLKVRVVNPKWRGCPEILKQFDYGGRVRGACCRAPEWMSYVPTERWGPGLSQALRDAEHARGKIKEQVRSSWRPGAA
jgi:hypothetical protein